MAKNSGQIKISVDHTREINSAVKSAIAKALEECGLVAENHAKTKLTEWIGKTPESWYRRTGNLRNSITHSVFSDEQQMVVGSNVEYAPYVEFGTGIYAEGGRKTPWVYKGSDGKFHKTSGMSARPYIKPSLADHIDQYKEILEKEIGNAMK